MSVAGERFEIGLIEGDDVDGVSATLNALGFNPVLVNDATHAGPGFSLLIEATQPSDLSLIAALNDVAWIADVGQLAVENFDTSAVAQSGNDALHPHPIWEKGLDGENMIIGVMDKGEIDDRSDFFRDPLKPKLGGSDHRKVVDNRRCKDCVPLPKPTKPDQEDERPHATRVCGCVAGDLFSDPGGNENRGGAYAAKIAFGDTRRFFDEDETRKPESTLLDEFDSAAKAGARIHNNSWNFYPQKDASSALLYDFRAAEVDDFLWRNQDHVLLVAASNPDKHFPKGHAIAKNPITVGGVEAPPNEGKRLPDPGPLTTDGRRKPDLLAVAEHVITSDLTETDRTPSGHDPLAVTPSPGVLGNSFATPHVAAAAALVRQYFLDGFYPNGKREGRKRAITPSGALLKAVLLNATEPLPGEPIPSQRDGWGRLRLNQTLHFDDDKLLLWIKDVRRGQGLKKTRAFRQYTLTVPAKANSMRITLVFNDRKGAPNAPHPEVNKLDLAVMEPKSSGFGFFGNDFVHLGMHSPQSIRRSLKDPLDARPDPAELKNNVQQVIVAIPTPGRWTIVVRAETIDQTEPESEPGKLPPLWFQGFALVASIVRS